MNFEEIRIWEKKKFLCRILANMDDIDFNAPVIDRKLGNIKANKR